MLLCLKIPSTLLHEENIVGPKKKKEKMKVGIPVRRGPVCNPGKK